MANSCKILAGIGQLKRGALDAVAASLVTLKSNGWNWSGVFRATDGKHSSSRYADDNEVWYVHKM